jgi:hypothetical protein
MSKFQVKKTLYLGLSPTPATVNTHAPTSTQLPKYQTTRQPVSTNRTTGHLQHKQVCHSTEIDNTKFAYTSCIKIIIEYNYDADI